MRRLQSYGVLSTPRRNSLLSAAASLLCVLPAAAQVMTVSTVPQPLIDRRYAQIEATHVTLTDQPLNAPGHQDILRALSSYQGFAMRPLPRGKKGLQLEANGKLTPSGDGYLADVTRNGLSVKAGDRVVLTDVRIDHDRIVFDINGGPEHKHEFLRHIQLGTGPDTTSSIIQEDDNQPTGSRITLTFQKWVPQITPAEVKSLLSPLISFDMKTPVQAYTDTLPPKLKDAILAHHVMVGMSTDMVLFALGQPESKSREMDGQTPFEEWIYGHPPQEVNFVRVNGNRVIRVEIARVGQPLEIYTEDLVQAMMLTDGRPEVASAAPHARTTQEGDYHPDTDTQAPKAPPTLRNPGEKLPQDDPNSTVRTDTMKPVIFPKDTTGDPARTVPAHPATPADPAPNATPSAPAVSQFVSSM